MAGRFRSRRNDTTALLFVFLFSVVFFYYECVFHLSTVGGIFRLGTLCMLLFSFAYGGIGYLLVSLIKSRKAAHIVTIVFLALCAVPFLVEYFVYRQFKVFYDVNTVVGGAGDAVGGFSRDIFGLLFSWDGLLKVVLYALPVVLYALFGRRLFPVTVGNAVRRCAGAAVLLLCYVAGLGGAYSTPVLWSAYETEYNFSAAVGHFGLLTGVRLDIKHGLFGKDDAFELMGEPDSAPESEPGVSEEPGDAGEDTPPTVEYGYNQLPLELNGGTGQVADLNSYVASLAPSRQNAYTGLFKGKNLIMITAEAFTAEVIDPVLTPTLYRLATQGIQFTDYYQPASAGTTGGEYQHVFGMLPMAGGMSFKNTASTLNYMTMGSQLDRLGYYGKAFHNNSYTYYSRHLTHVKLGYSDGFMGYGNGMEAYVRSLWPQSDLEMFAGTLPTYIGKQPFNVYYMTVSGHGGYSRVGNSMTNKNWDRVAHLTCSDPVKGYLAANLELEDAMAYVVNALEEAGIADDTVICLTTDHFPYGLDKDGKLGNMPYLSELYGHAVDNYFQRDHSQWILWCGALEEQEPIVVDTPTFSLDILPTLSNLFGTEFDSRLFPGRDVFSDAEPLVFNTNYDWKTVYGTYAASNGKFVPANPEAELPEGYVDRIKAIVRNKIRYCEWAPANDYFRHLFG